MNLRTGLMPLSVDGAIPNRFALFNLAKPAGINRTTPPGAAFGRGWNIQHLRHCLRIAETFPGQDESPRSA
jgi:hypothetical protein